MDLQKINIKFYFANDNAVSLESFIGIFNSWIQASDGEFYDIADYSHVHAGPGIMLIAHEANISIDNGGNRLGLLYGRKQLVEGSNGAKLRSAFATALEYCRRVEEAPALQGRLRFRGDEALVLVNDRLLAPNNEETFRTVRPDVEELAQVLYEGSKFSLEREQDAGRRFALHIKTPVSFDVTTLLKNVGENVN